MPMSRPSKFHQALSSPTMIERPSAVTPPVGRPRLIRGVRLTHSEAHGGWVLLAPERVFKADAITVLLPDLEESQRRETGAENLVIDEALKSLFPIPFSEGKPQCGRLKQEQVDFLFRDQAAAIESTAVVPLGDRAQTGLLAIGSREVNRFNPCMGTLFLSHLGELLSQLLQNHDTAWGP